MDTPTLGRSFFHRYAIRQYTESIFLFTPYEVRIGNSGAG